MSFYLLNAIFINNFNINSSNLNLINTHSSINSFFGKFFIEFDVYELTIIVFTSSNF